MNTKIIAQNWMGQVVTVNSILKEKREYRKKGINDGEYRFWGNEEVSEKAGWITGIRWLKEGWYHPAQYNSDNIFLPAYLKVERSIPVALVSFWPTTNPEYVAWGNWTKGGKPSAPKGEWSDKNRKILREIMKDSQRDKQGRWLKI